MTDPARTVEDLRDRVARAGRSLRPLRLGRVLDAVAEASRALTGDHRPASRDHPDPGGLRTHLHHALTSWTTGTRGALARAGLGETIRAAAPWPAAGGLLRGPRLLCVVSGRAAPGAGFDAALTGIVLRAPVLWRPGRDRVARARTFAEALREADGEVGEALGVVRFEREDEEAWRAFLEEAEAVCVFGPDEACRAIRERVPVGARVLPYPSRLSLGVCTREALAGGDLEELADDLARDVALLDQAGCLSVQAVVCEGRSDELAWALAEALEAIRAEMPPGPLEPERKAAVQAVRDTARMEGRTVHVPRDRSTAWTVVDGRDDLPDASPLGRTVFTIEVDDLDGSLETLLRPLRGRIQGVAVAGPDAMRDLLARRLCLQTGVGRVTVPGQVQTPPAGWAEDERPWPWPLVFRTDLDPPARPEE